MSFCRLNKVFVVPRRGFNLVKGLNEVVIVGAARTPIGSFKGALTSHNSPYLGAHVIKNAISRAGVPMKEVQEVYMGVVLQAGLGQDPARQAALFSGLSESTSTTTVNKLCASGMKAIMLAAQNIASGAVDVMVAGGMDSMTNAPFLLKRAEPKYGGDFLMDSLHQTLTDAFTKVLMVRIVHS